MRRWILISIMGVGLVTGSLSAIGQDAPQLSQKGMAIFQEVLAGDEERLPEALGYMEQARTVDGTQIYNLYTLGRAYFYEAVTQNRREALVKAEEVFARVIELQPNHTEAMSFHGSVLTALSRGQDIPKFMQGIREMKTAIESAPENINNRIVMAFTVQAFPPEALAAIGNYNALADLEMVSSRFAGLSFPRAPHADVVMKAFVAEAYKRRGDHDKAKALFEAALAVPAPDDSGKRAGREVLTAEITKRMNGGENSLSTNRIFTSCHSCHLRYPGKLLK